MRVSKKKSKLAVATWPRIEVEIAEDGTGLVRTAGVVTGRLAGSDAAGARAQAITQLAARAAELGRPVQATTQVPQGSFVIVVDADGTVRDGESDQVRAQPRTRRVRPTPADGPASLQREGAEISSVPEVPPTGQVRGPRPPFTPPAGAPTPPVPVAPVRELAPAAAPAAAPWWSGDAVDDMRLTDPRGLAAAAPAARLVDAVPAPAPGPRWEIPDLSAAAAPAPVPDPPAGRPVAGAVRGRSGRRWPALAAGGVVVLIAVGGVGGWRVLETRAASSAYEQLLDARADLGEQIEEAEDVLSGSEGKVSDEAVRAALLTAVQGAREASTAARVDAGAGSAPAGSWRDANGAVASAGRVLTDATEAVRAAQAAWELEQASQGWNAAMDALSAAIDDATAALMASEGKVADDSVRTPLSAAIDQAVQMRDRTASMDSVAELTAARDQATAVTDALAGPAQAVRDAQAAWEASQQPAAPAGRTPASQASTAAAGASKDPAPVQAPSGSRDDVVIEPGAASSSARTPGAVTVSATTSGVSGPVVVRIGSLSQTMGTGSGTFTVTVTGLDAGTYPWSVSADGATASGSALAQVF